MPKSKRESEKLKNGESAGLEAKLWAAADALRNNMDAAEYKHVVLGLIFIKYISDAFEAKHAELEAQTNDGADPEDRILGTLDGKINLNRRMNETLEAMTQALFKSWLVDFDPEGEKMDLWNDSWISDTGLKRTVRPSSIVNKTRLKALRPIVPRREVVVFEY